MKTFLIFTTLASLVMVVAHDANAQAGRKSPYGQGGQGKAGKSYEACQSLASQRGMNASGGRADYVRRERFIQGCMGKR